LALSPDAYAQSADYIALDDGRHFCITIREAMADMDFFTLPTLTFGVLYCFFVIAHDRRRVLHCNVSS
jgi:hypothetical protein